MDTPTIINPFHRDLFNALAPDIENRMISLASGGAQTIEAYREQCGYIRALNDVLSKCQELERERYGKRPGDKDD